MDQEWASEMTFKSYIYAWLCKETHSKAGAKNWIMGSDATLQGWQFDTNR